MSTPTLLKPPTANAEVVEFLEARLAEAKAGEISAVLLFACGLTERTISQGCVGLFDHADMVYNIEAWKHRMLREDFLE